MVHLGVFMILGFLKLYREAYRQLYKAYTIAATLPITSGIYERLSKINYELFAFDVRE